MLAICSHGVDTVYWQLYKWGALSVNTCRNAVVSAASEQRGRATNTMVYVTRLLTPLAP